MLFRVKETCYDIGVDLQITFRAQKKKKVAQQNLALSNLALLSCITKQYNLKQDSLTYRYFVLKKKFQRASKLLSRR